MTKKIKSDEDQKDIESLPFEASSFELPYINYKTNKIYWGPGPWQNEPDDLTFEYQGYKCELLRNKMGCWCGYVVIPKDHTRYAFYQENDPPIDVHGGITYRYTDDNGIFWIGFDCAHYLDLCPTQNAIDTYVRAMTEGPLKEKLLWAFQSYDNKTYRTIEFAIDQCKSMVDQLIKEQNES